MFLFLWLQETDPIQREYSDANSARIQEVPTVSEGVTFLNDCAPYEYSD